jgi:hypothetical protein
VPLHSCYEGSIPVQPLVIGDEVRLPLDVPESNGLGHGRLWLVLPRASYTERLVGHCEPFAPDTCTNREELLSWCRELEPDLLDVPKLTCIRLEMCDLDSDAQREIGRGS